MGNSLLDPLRAFRNKAPVAYTARTARGFGVGLARPVGQEAQMRAQGSSGVLFAIVDRIITAYSQVEWKLYKKAPSGLVEDRVEVTSHPALDMWRQPNPFMTGEAFREATQQHEELTGEQWWLIARDPRFTMPLELWPARPDRMEPVPDPVEFISGYRYRSPAGEQVPLALDEVVFQRRPSPLDPYRGLGPVQTVLTDMDAARYGVEWNRNFFLNSAQPGGIIEVDRRLEDDEFDEARDRWAEQHRGVSAAHHVAIIENGLKWVDTKFTQRDMQFAELSEVSDEKVRQAFGFPKPMLGTVSDVNRANADAAELVLSRWLLVPRLTRTRAALNTRILPMYGPLGEGYEFDFVSPVAEDIEAATTQLVGRATALQALVNAGVYGPDAAIAVGLPAMDFGAPDSDPNRELLIRLVVGAPSLAPIILPMLGFDISANQQAATPTAIAELVQKIYLGVGVVLSAEEAREVLVAAGADITPGASPTAPAAAGTKVGALAASLMPRPPSAAIPASFEQQAAQLLAGLEQPQDAMRWMAVSEHDDDVCQPCADNDGALYRNRAAAYADYPGGTGYIHCIGAQYGNDCRCKVVKRGKEGNDDADEE
ncbi:phage portal protein [Streptomyces sp. CA-111067]|uniref:phage portal protein n=1 Tax=Streptomyces sp. CA-111067 TaxID=3240046 RepID=UPI003D96251C